MIRLALVLALFLGFVAADVAGADPTPVLPTAEATASEPPEKARRHAGPAARHAPRWIPRQARRREEFGPVITSYPALLAPMEIPAFSF